MLSGDARTAGGKQRTYYRITPAGRSLLSAMKRKIEELHGEVVLDR